MHIAHYKQYAYLILYSGRDLNPHSREAKGF